MVLEAWASSSWGLTLIPSGPLVATATAGLGERSSFLPRSAMTASFGGREGRNEENMIRACEDVHMLSLLALMPVGTNGGGCDGREQSLHFPSTTLHLNS